MPVWALALAVSIALGISATWGYVKGKSHAESAAEVVMAKHLDADQKAEVTAREQAQRHIDELAVAQNKVAAAYEQGKEDAEAAAKRVTADLRAGALVLRERWTSCQARIRLPEAAPSPSEPDASTTDRDESAGRIIQAARQCDAQVKALQDLLTQYNYSN